MRPTPVQPRIDDPLALLTACHDKVRHFTRLAQRLRDHVAAHGVDDQARDAAVAVRRYFTMAAPLHHQDEDLDLYPALMAVGNAELNRYIHVISAEHDTLHALWLGLLPWLNALADGRTPELPTPDVDAFAQRYREHAQAEELQLYPYAKQLPPDTLRALAEAMSQRRQQPQP